MTHPATGKGLIAGCFGKRFSLPASVSSRLFPFFRSSGVRCRPCCITFPLGDDWATSASQPATRQCPPAGERQASGARQALVTVQRSHPSPTKKSPAERGQIRTTRKAGGLLWPCKGLLPAAPKDAGFHAVQAQCPCRLGYPLKGS